MKTDVLRAFWDSSGIVPLCCSQRFSPQAREFWRRFPKMVVWWNTPVEIRSAFVSLCRQGTMTDRQYTQAQNRLTLLHSRWREILPVEQIRDLAVNCLESYKLRAADALQLSAALLWCKGKPKRRPFVCFDQDLWLAAKEAGFDLLPNMRP